VVLQALNAEPERRFASMAEVKAHLRDAIANPGLTRAERRRQLASQALMASLAAAVIGAGAVWIWSFWGGGQGSARPPAASSQGRALLPAGRLGVFGTTPCPLDNETVSSVAMGGGQNEFGLALLPNGTVRAWGNNRFGQTNVPPGLRDVIVIAAGQGGKSGHAMGLRADGTVIGWGDNTFGQATPPAGLTGVVAIAAGELHSLALTRAGRVVAWGNSASPAGVVPGNLASAKAIAAGANFNLALLRDGRVIAWGLNDAGQCEVPQVSAQVIEIATGSKHAVARLDDGKVIAWGDNTAKQCDVPENLPGVAAVFAGEDGSAALDQSGRLYVWGQVPEGLNFTGHVAQVAMGGSTWGVIERNKVARPE
jgi:alpha-tubulin suppressor-like RCC1 family protein